MSQQPIYGHTVASLKKLAKQKNITIPFKTRKQEIYDLIFGPQGIGQQLYLLQKNTTLSWAFRRMVGQELSISPKNLGTYQLFPVPIPKTLSKRNFTRSYIHLPPYPPLKKRLTRKKSIFV